MRSIVFYIAWILLTLIFGILGLPSLLHSRAVWWVSDRWCSATFWLLKTICHIHIATEKLPQSAGKLFAANHESTLDTLMLWHALHRPAFVLKRELYFIPIFGWYLWRTSPIAVRRGSSASIQPMIAQAKDRLSNNRAVIIFPEGTRSSPERIITYKRGIALLSKSLATPVTLLALATDHVWPKGSLKKSPGTAQLKHAGDLAICQDDAKNWLENMAQIIRESAKQLSVK